MRKGRIFKIEKYAIHDGPGIRTTIFFKGCPLRCRWCHNPEGQSQCKELVYLEARCIGCGICVKKCPRKAVSQTSEKVILNRKSCNVCGACAQICPSEALSIVGEDIGVGNTIDAIERDMVFFEESEGGVTFSGGEPLLQPDFLKALMIECKERGIHTALDTSGYASKKVIAKVSNDFDLFLYDIKSLDEAKHRRYTGVSNKIILENLQRLIKVGCEVAVSVPIIPSINDDEENMRKTREFLCSLKNVKCVSLLPYHNAGVVKYRNLGRQYELEKVQTPSPQEMAELREKFESCGLNVRMGGR